MFYVVFSPYLILSLKECGILLIKGKSPPTSALCQVWIKLVYFHVTACFYFFAMMTARKIKEN